MLKAKLGNFKIAPIQLMKGEGVLQIIDDGDVKKALVAIVPVDQRATWASLEIWESGMILIPMS